MLKSYKIILGGLFTFLPIFFTFSQPDTLKISKKEKIDQIIFNAIRQKAFPVAVLFVQQDDSVLIHKAYGHHTYDSLRKTDTTHLYDLASITKIAASTLALMKLYDDGCIELDAPIRNYVSGFGWNKRGETTLRQSLSHQAGWKSWIPYYKKMRKKNGKWKRRFFDDERSEKYPYRISHDLYLSQNNYRYIKRRIKRSEFDPEKGYQYSGLIFYLIPEIVENLTHMDFRDFLNEEFYDPLGLETMDFKPSQSYDPGEIVPTEIDTFFRQEPIHGVVHDEGAILMDGISGNAGLFSKASDLAKLMELFLASGRMDTTQYLRPQTVRLFTSSQYPDNRRALGFDKPLLEYDSVRSSVAEAASFGSFGHTGYTGTMVWADPEYDLIFVFLSNRVYPSRENKKLYELNIRPEIHKLVYEIIQNP